MHLRSRKIIVPVVWAASLLVAASGTAFAAAQITGQDIKDGTVRGVDLANGSVTNADLNSKTRKGIIKDAVRKAVTEMPAGASFIDVDARIAAAINALPTHATPAEVATAKAEAIAAASTIADAKIAAAVASLGIDIDAAEATAELRAQGLDSDVADLVAELDTHSTTAEVTAAIDAAIDSLGDDVAADLDAETAARIAADDDLSDSITALGNVATDEEVADAIADAIDELSSTVTADIATAKAEAIAAAAADATSKDNAVKTYAEEQAGAVQDDLNSTATSLIGEIANALAAANAYTDSKVDNPEYGMVSLYVDRDATLSTLEGPSTSGPWATVATGNLPDVSGAGAVPATTSSTLPISCRTNHVTAGDPGCRVSLRAALRSAEASGGYIKVEAVLKAHGDDIARYGGASSGVDTYVGTGEKTIVDFTPLTSSTAPAMHNGTLLNLEWGSFPAGVKVLNADGSSAEIGTTGKYAGPYLVIPASSGSGYTLTINVYSWDSSTDR